MFDVKQLYTDHTLEVEGRDFSLGADAGIKLARIGNPKFQAAHERRLEDLRRDPGYKYGDPTHRAEMENAALVESLVETIVMAWWGFTEGDTPLPYSPANARKLLRDSRDFRDLVVNLASQGAAYRQEADADTEKNSEASSAGV